jgi:ABC-type uncharacterized transport system permease subunit
MALPVLLLALCVFNISPPDDATAGICFVFSAILAFHLFFTINFLTGLLAAWTEKVQGFLWAKFMLLQFLSGLLLPVTYMPPWMQILFRWLPFQGMSYTPMIIYLGRVKGQQLIQELAIQAAWTLALVVACGLMWRRVRRRLETLGG